jgi:maltose O-acetyltransferase
MTDKFPISSRRVVGAVVEELGPVHLRWTLVAIALRLIPSFRGIRVRTALLRAGGWRIARGSVLLGRLRVFGNKIGRPSCEIGVGCAINVGCTFELSDRIVVGDGVSLGPDVMILTGTHRLGPHAERAGEFHTGPVTIGDGAWIGARSVILPGVTVGAGAVVSANSVVNKNVPPDSLVAGVPAVIVVKRLPR